VFKFLDRWIMREWMAILLFIIVVVMLGGCAPFQPYPNQYRAGDPCIKCGERFEQIPNFEYEAIVRKQRGETW
jgi:hypothetical protein